MHFDIAIIGAGIVGLATALQIQRRSPNLRILVLEKEDRIAAHQSSHNSGVIHSGIYYRPGSLRAVNCRRGYDLLLDFCREQDLPHEVCGKLIVAVEEKERAQLTKILENGVANGLRGIERLSKQEVREREPHVQALEALFVPQAGITDYAIVAAGYARFIRENDGVIRTGSGVTAIRPRPRHVEIECMDIHVTAGLLINCAGLYADKIAEMAGLDPEVRILPFRGEYYELLPERTHLVRNPVYPVPNPNFPFLGVHFTRMIGGGVEAGPNAVLAFRREGYTRRDIHFCELMETLRFPGFRKIAAKYWRDGWQEFRRSYSKTQFVRALQRLIPEIRAADLHEGRSGVRAMACAPDGALLDDFLILERPRMIHVLNAPSPAATASLAIGETLAQKALLHFPNNP